MATTRKARCLPLALSLVVSPALHAQGVVTTAQPREISFPAAVVQEFQRNGFVRFAEWNLNLRLADGIKPIVGPVNAQEVLMVVDQVVIGFVGEPQTAETLGRSVIESARLLQAESSPLGRNLIVMNATPAPQARGKPLIIIDGVVVSGEFADVPKERIESIEVVKGAAAYRLYGDRAAAGVIMITTKR